MKEIDENKIAADRSMIEQLNDISIAIEKATAIYAPKPMSQIGYFTYLDGQLRLSVVGAIVVGSGMFTQEMIGNDELTESKLFEMYPALNDYNSVHPERGKSFNLFTIISNLESEYSHSASEIVIWLKSEINKIDQSNQPANKYEVIATQKITCKFVIKADSEEEAREIALEITEGNAIEIDESEREIILVNLAAA